MQCAYSLAVGVFEITIIFKRDSDIQILSLKIFIPNFVAFFVSL